MMTQAEHKFMKAYGKAYEVSYGKPYLLGSMEEARFKELYAIFELLAEQYNVDLMSTWETYLKKHFNLYRSRFSGSVFVLYKNLEMQPAFQSLMDTIADRKAQQQSH